MDMSKEERTLALDEAQEKLFEAIELIESAFPNDGWVEAYVVAPLQIRASRDNPYLSSNPNLDDLKDRIEDEESSEVDYM